MCPKMCTWKFITELFIIAKKCNSQYKCVCVNMQAVDDCYDMDEFKNTALRENSQAQETTYCDSINMKFPKTAI